MKELAPNLYSVGVKNPGLKYFDVIVPTDAGTTYNSYLLRGEKTVLFETVQDSFADELIANIEEICPVTDIDCIVCDHTEPDHSGALGKILDMNPDVTVYGSAPALKNLGNIMNREFNKCVAKNNDVLDIGGYTLKFISAPNLHWPDSIFTYVDELKAVFTCDFLGCHFCSDTAEDERYESELKTYFTYIFGPFGAPVQKGVQIIKDLSPAIVCPSHGPVLTDKISRAVELYEEWSKSAVDPNKISIFYVSCYGYTKAMAEALAKGVRLAGKNACVYEASTADKSELAEAVSASAAYMFGSPTLNRDALPPIWDVLNMVSAVTDRNKKALFFGSYGWSGEACANLAARAQGLGLKVEENLCKICFKPTEDDLEHLISIGKAFAE